MLSKFQSDEDQDMQNNCYFSVATDNNGVLKSEGIIIELYSFKATYTGTKANSGSVGGFGFSSDDNSCSAAIMSKKKR